MRCVALYKREIGATEAVDDKQVAGGEIWDGGSVISCRYPGVEWADGRRNDGVTWVLVTINGSCSRFHQIGYAANSWRT